MPDVAVQDPLDPELFKLIMAGSGGQTVNLDAVRTNAQPQAPAPQSDAYKALQALGAQLGKAAPSSIKDNYDTILKLAPEAVAPSKEHLDAEYYTAQQEGNKKILEMLSQPLPPATHLQRDDVAPLSLPNAPVAQPNQINPVASLAAGIAGLFHPQAAGEFGAAALEGALRKTQQENQQKQAEFQNNIERLTAIHRDAIERADAKLRVDALNKQSDDTRSHEQMQRDMAKAKAAGEDITLGKEATATEAFAKQQDTAAQAKAKIGVLESQAQSEADLYDKGQERAMTGVVKVAGIDAAAEKETQTEKARKELAAQNKAADLSRQTQRDKDAMARTQANIASRQAIAKGSQALQARRIEVMRQNGMTGRSGKASMEHLDYQQRAAWSKAEQARQRLGQVEKSADSPSPMDSRSPDERQSAIIQAQQAYDAALSNFTQIGDAKRAHEQGSAPNMPPPGAHVRKYNPVTGKVE